MNIKNKYETLSEVNFYPDEINVPKEFSWIKNFEEFKNNFSDKKWIILKKYKRIYDFLNNIKVKLLNWKDPIKYLYYLYYDVELSTLDLEDLLWHFWNYSRWNISSILNLVFWWKLRHPNRENHKTKLKKEKDKNKIKVFNKEQSNKKQKKVEKVENILNRLSKNKEKNEFSQEIFSSIKNVRGRSQYILDINWYIPDDLFIENLIKLSDKYGMKVTAQAITNILEQETNKIWNIDKIELRAGRIREIKNEQN